MSGAINRRRLLLDLAREGVTRTGAEAAQSLVLVPHVTAALLEHMAGEPVRAYIAVGTDEVAALEAFVAGQRKGEK